MKKTIYRKLKDYIYEGESGCTIIFGDLMDSNCVFNYEDTKKEGHYIDYRCVGLYYRDMDFLLNYYVIGIHARYRIERDTIKPYLYVVLSKEPWVLE